MENQIKWNKASEVLPELIGLGRSATVWAKTADGNRIKAYFNYYLMQWVGSRRSKPLYNIIEWAAITPPKD